MNTGRRGRTSLVILALAIALQVGCGDDRALRIGGADEAPGDFVTENDAAIPDHGGDDAGSDAAADQDTADVHALCGADEHVSSGACVPCGAGASNGAGDDPAGPDTSCDDACLQTLGIECAAFEEAYIKASNAGADDYFGYSVSHDGDTLVVGAPYEDSSATGVGGDQLNNERVETGAVYVFTRSGTTWAQQAYIKASFNRVNDRFGWIVSVSGDTLAVGAPYEDGGDAGINGDENNDEATESGAVYVFARTGTTWNQEAYIKASNAGPGDHFGEGLSLDGDTLVVGAFHEDGSALGQGGDEADDSVSDSGAAYVFTRAGTTWTQQAYLKASNAGVDDFFGRSVAVDGDTLAVGAYGEASNASDVGGDQANDEAPTSGAAYVFTRSGATWTQQAYIKASNPEIDDLFGWTLDLSGDTLAVAAFREDSKSAGVGGDQANNDEEYSGAVYVFTRADTTWAQQAYIKASNPGEDDLFGKHLSLDGDTLAVGSRRESSNATGFGGDQANDAAAKSGAVYLFTRAGTVWNQRGYIKASNTDPADQFGNSVSVDGNTLVTAALYESSGAAGIEADQADNAALYAGAVYVRRIAP